MFIFLHIIKMEIFIFTNFPEGRQGRHASPSGGVPLRDGHGRNCQRIRETL